MAQTKAPREQASRRQLPLAEKRRIVELTLRSGASVIAVAREHDISPNSLYRWKQLYRAGGLDAQGKSSPRALCGPASASFVPVRLVPAVSSPQPKVHRDTAASGSGIMHLAFASGATLRIETGALDAALVCALVAELRR